jgi:hypothetical protein
VTNVSIEPKAVWAKALVKDVAETHIELKDNSIRLAKLGTAFNIVGGFALLVLGGGIVGQFWTSNWGTISKLADKSEQANVSVAELNGIVGELGKAATKNSEQIEKTLDGLNQLRTTVAILATQVASNTKAVSQNSKVIETAATEISGLGSGIESISRRLDSAPQEPESIGAVIVVTKPILRDDKKWCITAHLIDPALGFRKTYTADVSSENDDRIAVQVKGVVREYPSVQTFGHCEKVAGEVPDFVWKEYSFCFRSTPVGITSELKRVFGDEKVQVRIISSRWTWSEVVHDLEDSRAQYVVCDHKQQANTTRPIPMQGAVPKNNE